MLQVRFPSGLVRPLAGEVFVEGLLHRFLGGKARRGELRSPEMAGGLWLDFSKQRGKTMGKP